ncbi:MAG: right-handed parallel beta-helix repeat-containing protein, partial [Planctomycetota bacterium]
GGGGIYCEGNVGTWDAGPLIAQNIIRNNHAPCGGGITCGNAANVIINNNLLYGNVADIKGGAVYLFWNDTTISSNTITGNSAPDGAAIHCVMPGSPVIFNNIIAFNTGGGALSSSSAAGNPVVTYNGFWANTGGHFGGYIDPFDPSWIGNIETDPIFVDPDNEDFRLQPGSLCIDSGDTSAVTVDTDLDGNPRISNGIVDMGAYEFQHPVHVSRTLHVDADGTGDFDTIQPAINDANNGDTIVVWPGVYAGRINFKHKAITITSAAYPAVIESPGQDAVSFHLGEGPGSVLQNLVIRGSGVAVACNNESSPTLKNLTIVNNDFGIAAYEGSNPDISNCILWNNRDGDLWDCEARYSCVESGSTGIGSISVNPLPADLEGGDYHLLSEKGRYVPAYGLWSFDHETSPCVDGGDPSDDPSTERMPNGGRINIGAYGGTEYASMSEWPLAHDENRDGRTDFKDLAGLCDEWLLQLPWAD